MDSAEDAPPAPAPARALKPGRPTLALLLASVLALAVWLSSEWSYRGALASLDSLGERAAARQSIQTVLRRLLDAETAQRGYLLTSRPSYLQPLDEVKSDVDRELARLAELCRGDAQSLALVQQLSARALEKLSELDVTLAMQAAGEHERWRELVLSDIGREKMQAVRDVAELLMVAEDARAAAGRATVDRTLQASRVGVHASTLLALVGLIFFLRQTAALQATQAAHARALQGERDTLDRQVRERTLALSELNRHLQDVREAERGKLARSLHDDLGALLTAAKLDLARLRRALASSPAASAADVSARLAHLTDTIDQGITIKRILIEDLWPSALHNLGLRAALEILASDFTLRTSIAVRLQADDQELMHLPMTPRIVAFRLVQTCLSNVEQHAGTDEVEVSVQGTAAELRVRVRDPGRGFDPAAVPATRRDLASFRYRVESLGGTLRIRSAPGEGTEVEACMPWVDMPVAATQAVASTEDNAC